MLELDSVIYSSGHPAYIIPTRALVTQHLNDVCSLPYMDQFTQQETVENAHLRIGCRLCRWEWLSLTSKRSRIDTKREINDNHCDLWCED